ncbi:MAG: PilZ domain-containing protein [Desulfobacterales bacterium]|nr:PilZ domain-containing protein [Desulfobacterales bacterium]
MYKITEFPKENCILIMLKDIGTEEIAEIIVKEAVQKLRTLKKNFYLIFEFREYEPSVDGFEIEYLKKFFRPMTIRRPKLIIVIGQEKMRNAVQQAFIELNLDLIAKLLTAERPKDLPRLLLDDKGKDLNLLEWFKNHEDYSKEFTEALESKALEEEEEKKKDAQTLNISSFDVYGNFVTNQPITFRVTVKKNFEGNPLYKFFYFPDSAHIEFNEKKILPLIKEPYIIKNECACSFSKPGRYFIGVFASANPNSLNFAKAAQLFTVLTIKDESINKSSQTTKIEKIDDSINKIFVAEKKIDIIFKIENNESITRASKVLNDNAGPMRIITTQTNPPIPANIKYENMYISTLSKRQSGEFLRIGYSSRLVEILNFSESSTEEALLIECTPPLRKIELRSEKGLKRNPLEKTSINFDGTIVYKGSRYASDKFFSIKDISMTGIGITAPKEVDGSSNPILDIKIGDYAHIELLLPDNNEENSKISAYIEVVRKDYEYSQLDTFIGLKFYGKKRNHEKFLSKYVY